MALSSTSWISLPLPRKKTDVLRGMATIPGFRGGYLLANNHDTSGLALQWLLDNVVAPDDGLAGTGGPGSCSYDDLTALAATSPPGANGEIFTPWLAGERTPVSDSHLRGGFHNVSLRTTRADLVRAVLEGVAYNDHWLHGYVERFAKRRLDPVRVVGGGAQSELWCQIHADVMDRTIEQVEDPVDAQLRGAAVLAGISLGLVDWSEVRGLARVARTFTPDPANRDAYDRLSAALPRLCPTQRPMIRRPHRRPRWRSPAGRTAPPVRRSRHAAGRRRYDRCPPSHRGRRISVVTVVRGQQMDGAEAPEPTGGAGVGADDTGPVPPDIAARIVRAVDRSPSSVVTLVNPDLPIAWVSQSARWVTGSDPDSRRGDSAVARIHPDDAHRLAEGLAQLRAARGHHDYLTTVPEPIRYRFQRFDGTWVVMEATIHNLLGDPEA